MLRSTACRYEQFETPWYRKWAEALGYPTSVSRDVPISYRKIWEWAAIAEVLDSRGMLAPGKRGAGFAVGQEPLAALFANRGVEITGTDLGTDESQESWTNTGQHASSREAMFQPKLIERGLFEQLVTFQPADMNDPAGFPRGRGGGVRLRMEQLCAGAFRLHRSGAVLRQKFDGNSQAWWNFRTYDRIQRLFE